MKIEVGDAGRSALLTLAMLLPMTASAAWVNLVDDTSNRLRLRPFVDTANPGRDTQEKDIAVADLNRDGWEDAVVVRKRRFSDPGARQDVLLMNFRGRLIDATAVFAPGFIEQLSDARDVFIADFTGDAWPDVVIANTFGQQPLFYRNLGNDADGRWRGLRNESQQRFPLLSVPGDLSTLQFCAVWGGDVTGNGALDLYFSNYDAENGTTDVLFINDGNGVFANQSTQRLGENASVAFGTSVEIGDVDNDGDNDIVKNNATFPIGPFEVGAHVLYNNGLGVFRGTPQKLPGLLTYMFTMGDLNNDQQLDFYMVNDFVDNVSLAKTLVPDGPGDYRQRNVSSPRTFGFGGNVKMADLDNDGDLDLGLAPIDTDIANCGPGAALTLFENPGNGLLRDTWNGNEPFLLDAFDLGFIDINNDGCKDMFLGLCEGWRVFMQACQ